MQEHAGVRQLLVVLAHLGQELLAGQVAGFPESLIIIITRTSCLLPVDLGPDADRVRTQALPGRRTREGEIDRVSSPAWPGGRRHTYVAKRGGRTFVANETCGY